MESVGVKKVSEGGKSDNVYSFKCKKAAKRGGFTQRRYTKAKKAGEKEEGCQSDEFMCGAHGKYENGARLTGLQCCYGDNIEVSESETETYEETVTITESSTEVKSTKDSEAICTSFEMM